MPTSSIPPRTPSSRARRERSARHRRAAGGRTGIVRPRKPVPERGRREVSMTVRIGINGFGRIGRNFTRAVFKRPDSGVELVAVNDLSDAAVLAHLLHYDTVLGPLEGVRVTDDGIEVGS